MYSTTVKTLDLSAFVEKTLEVKMVDGRTLHLKRPTKAIVIQLQAIQEMDDVAKKVDAMKDIITAAMSNNTEGIVINRTEIDAMPEIMVNAIANGYFDFIHELVSAKNS